MQDRQLMGSAASPAAHHIAKVGALELIQLYLTSNSFAEAVEELEKRYETSDFEVSIASIPLMYILQERQSVQTVLEANTRTGFHNRHFDVSHGHSLNINAVQAFSEQDEMTHHPLWESIHKGFITSIGNRELINKIIDKHIHLLFTQKHFTLDKSLERFMLHFWCEYIFGPEVNADDLVKTRDKLLKAMKYAFYDNSWKNIPVLGELTCRFYGWMKGVEFAEVDDELRAYLNQSSTGLMHRMRQYLQASETFPKELVDQAVLDNTFDFIIVFDFIHNVMYETLASIIKN